MHLSALSKIEIAILDEMVRGRTDVEIGLLLGRSEHSTRYIVRRLIEAHGLLGRANLAALYTLAAPQKVAKLLSQKPC